MFYRAGIEAILGVQKQGNMLRVRPFFPQHWDELEFEIKFGSAHYHLCMRHGEITKGDHSEVETVSANELAVTMVDDGKTHHLNLVFANQGDIQNKH